MSVEGSEGQSAPIADVQSSEVIPSAQSEISGEVAAKPEAEQPKTLDDKLSSKFAALSRKEKAIKLQELQFRQNQQAMQQQLAEIKSENERIKKEFESYRTGVKQTPLQKLQEEGVSFDDLTTMQMNDQNPTPEMLIKRVRQELETGYQSQFDALKKQLAEEKQKTEQELESRTVTQYKQQIKQHAEANDDKYELVNLHGKHEDAYEVIEEIYKTEDRILTIDEALDYVEQHLTNEANKILKAKKFQARAVPQAQKPLSDKLGSPSANNSMTLSNNLSAEVPKGSSKQLTWEQQKEEAAKLLRWET